MRDGNKTDGNRTTKRTSDMTFHVDPPPKLIMAFYGSQRTKPHPWNVVKMAMHGWVDRLGGDSSWNKNDGCCDRWGCGSDIVTACAMVLNTKTELVMDVAVYYIRTQVDVDQTVNRLVVVEVMIQ